MLEVIPFDPTGKAPSNLIQQEIHVITKQNYRDYHYIVPTFAPFFSETSYDGVDTPVKLTIKLLDNTVKELSEGIDYVFTHKFVTASRSIALSDVVGSITFMDNELAGVVTIDKYQALGGEWLVTNDEISKILMETAINPRITYWEAVAGRPTTFPVINHDYDIINLKGTEEVIESIDRVSLSIIEYLKNDIGFTNTQILHMLNNKLGKTETSVNSNKLEGLRLSEITQGLNTLIDSRFDQIKMDLSKYATLQQLEHVARRSRIYALIY